LILKMEFILLNMKLKQFQTKKKLYERWEE
jgi:hypothetical protein